MDIDTLTRKLQAADIAFARVNDVAGFIAHPHLRRISVDTPSGQVSYPAPAAIRDEARRYGRVPSLGEHTEKVRKEFG
jgi:formyl-CoA transferase